MKARIGAAVAAVMLVLVLPAAGHADTIPDLTADRDELRSSGTIEQLLTVDQPSRPCAAPAFARPIDRVDPQLLADTGWSRALQVAGLAALAMAALLAPRRFWGDGSGEAGTPIQAPPPH